jgi:hypothetical protein
MFQLRCVAAQPQKEKVSHRPLRTFKHGALNFLIEGLYLDVVVEAKGKLTTCGERPRASRIVRVSRLDLPGTQFVGCLGLVSISATLPAGKACNALPFELIE